MLIESLNIPRADFEAATGWALKPEGACRGELCVPLNPAPQGHDIDVEPIAAALGMPLVKAAGQDLWALGPAVIGNRALATAEAPNLTLPDLQGNAFELSSQRGKKVVVYAWAPY